MSLRARAVDAVFGALELLASLYDWVRRMRRVKVEDTDATDPIPLRPAPRKRDTSRDTN